MPDEASSLNPSSSTTSGKRDTALWFFQRGYELQMAGHWEDAGRCYKKSLELYPTAEVQTFLGWIYSLQGRYGDAIHACEQAIRMDPEIGNPYNDIGAYLIQLNRVEEAIPWLEKAALAKRYDVRCFPYHNLGRAYEKLGKWREAMTSYEQALSLNPDYRIALQALNRIKALAN